MPTDELLKTGHYAKKQIFCPSRIIRWSHSSRFRLGRKLVMPYRGRELLDYGCGDGSFIALVADLFPRVVGVDINPGQLRDCSQRFADVKNVEFRFPSELSDPQHEDAYAVVTCMETLEHCIDPVLNAVIDDLDRLVARDGVVIISVPIEIGPTLPLKQIVRTIAGWRRLGDYAYNERYTWGQMLKMIFSSAATPYDRPVYRTDANDPATAFHGHAGFNWRKLRARLVQTFDIQETRFSPLNLSRGLLSSQAWFICRPRAGANS